MATNRRSLIGGFIGLVLALSSMSTPTLAADGVAVFKDIREMSTKAQDGAGAYFSNKYNTPILVIRSGSDAATEFIRRAANKAELEIGRDIAVFRTEGAGKKGGPEVSIYLPQAPPLTLDISYFTDDTEESQLLAQAITGIVRFSKDDDLAPLN